MRNNFYNVFSSTFSYPPAPVYSFLRSLPPRKAHTWTNERNSPSSHRALLRPNNCPHWIAVHHRSLLCNSQDRNDWTAWIKSWRRKSRWLEMLLLCDLHHSFLVLSLAASTTQPLLRLHLIFHLCNTVSRRFAMIARGTPDRDVYLCI
jgi:hypothetical protein